MIQPLISRSYAARERLFGLILIAALALLAVAVPTAGAQAVALGDLTALAAHAPEGTSIFAAVRIDEGYIDTLDGLIAELGARLPELIPPGTSLRPALDTLARDTFFETDLAGLRPWLGDTAALIVTNIQPLIFGGGNAPVYIGLGVRDQAAAQAALDAALAEDIAAFRIERVTLETGGVLYQTSNPQGGTSYLLTQDALFTTVTYPFFDDLIPVTPRLPESLTFQAAIDALPADNYNALIYLDVEFLLQTGLNLLIPALPESLDLDRLRWLAGQQAIGLTLLNDGRSLVADVAFSSQIPYMGYDIPLDLSLAERVPEDAALVILSDGLGQTTLDTLDLLEGFAETLDRQLDLDLGPITASNGVLFLRQMIAGTLGIDLDATLGALNGTYAFYAGAEVTPEGARLMQGLVIANRSPALTADLVNGIARVTTDIFARATYEDNTLTLPGNLLFSDDFAVQAPPALLTDMQVAYNDDYLAVGTAPEVGFALAPSAAGLSQSPIYAAQQALFLENPQAIWLLSLAAVREEWQNALAQDSQGALMQQIGLNNVQVISLLLGLFDSLAITTSTPGGTVSVRFTMTLSGQ